MFDYWTAFLCIPGLLASKDKAFTNALTERIIVPLLEHYCQTASSTPASHTCSAALCASRVKALLALPASVALLKETNTHLLTLLPLLFPATGGAALDMAAWDGFCSTAGPEFFTAFPTLDRAAVERTLRLAAIADLCRDALVAAGGDHPVVPLAQVASCIAVSEDQAAGWVVSAVRAGRWDVLEGARVDQLRSLVCLDVAARPVGRVADRLDAVARALDGLGDRVRGIEACNPAAGSAPGR